MKTLKDAQVGETVTVAKLHGDGPVKRRIMDMGITKGTDVYVRKLHRLEIRWRLPSAATSYPCVKQMPRWLKFSKK